MKLRIVSSVLMLGLTGVVLAAPAVVPAPVVANGKVYFGVFGGGGSSNKFNVSQFGTAYYTEASGGPLAVNAFGQANSESSAFFGAQVGYQAPAIMLVPSSSLVMVPAAELEVYGMNNSTFNAALSNDNVRLDEHDFSVSYPMSRTIFLANAVFGFDRPNFIVHPYIGLGIGEAVVRIAGANAAQISPAEPGINHYNANNSDTTSVFAGQIKFGLGYDVSKSVSVFADYRWLYIANTQFLFGSTIATGHPETSSWQVKLDAQRYNLVNVGVRFTA